MTCSYDMNLMVLVEKFGDDEHCREYLEGLRWPEGPICPRCGSASVARVHTRNALDCNSCRHRFTVTAGTIMHDTHLPLCKWFMAVYLMVDSKKGISALQLKRCLDVSYQTAWHLCHRIRAALQTPSALLSGVVEVDETYIGGVKRGYGRGYRRNKSCVVGVIQRGGELRTKRIRKANRKTLRQFIAENVDDDVLGIFTDENPAYGNMSDHNTLHATVNHSKEEWVRGHVHTNGIENAWSLFKRSVVGAYHKVSKKHLDRYLDEFEFRFNNRDNPFIFRDAVREVVTEGERLMYQDLVA